MTFVKGGGHLISSTLINALKTMIYTLQVTTRKRILKMGEIRAIEMQNQYEKSGVFQWASQLKNWITEPSFLLWLGAQKLNHPKLNPRLSDQ
jgi:hypothetical protein